MREQKHVMSRPVAMPTQVVPYKRKQSSSTITSDCSDADHPSSVATDIGQSHIPDHDVNAGSYTSTWSERKPITGQSFSSQGPHQNDRNVLYQDHQSATRHSQYVGHATSAIHHHGTMNRASSLSYRPGQISQHQSPMKYHTSYHNPPHTFNPSHQENDDDTRQWLRDLAHSQTSGHNSDLSGIQSSGSSYSGYKRPKNHRAEADFSAYSKKARSASPEQSITVAKSLL